VIIGRFPSKRRILRDGLSATQIVVSLGSLRMTSGEGFAADVSHCRPQRQRGWKIQGGAKS
jgi:hypothetical protein